MKFNKYLICALFLVLICCIGAASAADSDDVVAADDAIDEEVTEAVDVSDEIDEETLGVSEEPALSDGETPSSSEKVIYVGTNGTDGGDGSPDNPFSALDSARADVNEYKEKVTVNINDGNYTIGELLQFNTSNLHIKAVGNNVILKNLLDTTSAKQAFGLVESNNGNFKMSNVIFDGSGWTRQNGKNYYFSPFVNGNDNIIKFDNCTFIGFNGNVNLLPYSNQNSQVNLNNIYEFTNCKFINYTTTSTRGIGMMVGGNVTFVNCVFSFS